MLNEMVRRYENGLMVSALKKVADGKPRTPKEIANITGLSWNEVAGNFFNMSRDDHSYDYHRVGRRDISRFRAIQGEFEIIRSRQRVERKYVAIDENGQLDLDHPFIRKFYKTTYTVTRR